MLEAKKASVWKNSYDITADGQRLATWDGSWWKAGGTFELDGRRYKVRANMWGNKYGMVGEDGTPVAAADRVGRKRWTVEADGLPLPVQIFVLAVVLTKWDQSAAAANGGATGAGG